MIEPLLFGIVLGMMTVSLAGLFVVYIVQLVFYFLSKFISIQYFEYINVFNTLSYSLFFISISGICGMILNSKTYSKISISIIFSLFGFFVNLIGIYIVMKHDLGLNGIAFSMVISVFMSTFPLFIFCKQALFKQRGDLMKLFILWFVPVFILMYLQVFFFSDLMEFSLIALIILTVSSLIKRREIYNLIK